MAKHKKPNKHTSHKPVKPSPPPASGDAFWDQDPSTNPEFLRFMDQPDELDDGADLGIDELTEAPPSTASSSPQRQTERDSLLEALLNEPVAETSPPPQAHSAPAPRTKKTLLRDVLAAMQAETAEANEATATADRLAKKIAKVDEGHELANSNTLAEHAARKVIQPMDDEGVDDAVPSAMLGNVVEVMQTLAKRAIKRRRH